MFGIGWFFVEFLPIEITVILEDGVIEYLGGWWS